METWRTSTVHVRCVYSGGIRVVSRLVKIDFWGKSFWEWVKFCNPRVAVECKFSAPQKHPKLLRSRLRLFRTQLQGGNEAKTAGETIILLSKTMIFEASRGFGCNVLRSLHVFVCFTFSLHVMLQTMARLPFVAGNGHFYLSKWCLASTPSTFFSSWQLWSPWMVYMLSIVYST